MADETEIAGLAVTAMFDMFGYMDRVEAMTGTPHLDYLAIRHMFEPVVQAVTHYTPSPENNAG